MFDVCFCYSIVTMCLLLETKMEHHILIMPLIAPMTRSEIPKNYWCASLCIKTKTQALILLFIINSSMNFGPTLMGFIKEMMNSGLGPSFIIAIRAELSSWKSIKHAEVSEPVVLS